MDNLIGPDPPLLTNLDIQSSKQFFDPSQLDKKVSVCITLKSEDVAATLKRWVAVKAITPTSEFFHILSDLKSNKLNDVGED